MVPGRAGDELQECLQVPARVAGRGEVRMCEGQPDVRQYNTVCSLRLRLGAVPMLTRPLPFGEGASLCTRA